MLNWAREVRVGGGGLPMPSHSGHLLARGKGKGTANDGKSLSQGIGVGRWMVCSANVSGKGREVLARPAK